MFCIMAVRKILFRRGMEWPAKWFNYKIAKDSCAARKAVMPLKADLDAIDWKILRELQHDGRMTNVELSSRVGISAPPCLRRVRRLEETGIIRGYRALLNAPALGLDVVAFCLIGLHHQADAELKTFAERTRGWPIVRDAWMVSGESDFLLHCVASDLGAFQTFVIEELASAPNVDTVRTALTIRRVKDEGLVAFSAK
jgi:DNA-binding Lrp family transcriptional regulator